MAALVPPRAFETLYVGDPAPWFSQRCIGQEGAFSFDMVAGRFVALCFYGAADDVCTRDALDRVEAQRAMFDNVRLAFFGVTNDPLDEHNPSLLPTPGVRHFADLDGSVAQAYGAAARRFWCILDPRLRVVGLFPLNAEGNAAALRFLSALPTPAVYGDGAQVPVLAIPGVFEPDFCARLITLHQSGVTVDSAILTEGATLTDHGFKRRLDCRITDKTMAAQTQTRIFRRVVPEVRHAFQFQATRMERLIVACYDAADQGRFGAHRDNTVAATAHRRFAVSVNLNEDYEGGGIVFPEYSTRPFKPAAGTALVFSCSLLHAVAPVTKGRRYACLPFVYDGGAAVTRAP